MNNNTIGQYIYLTYLPCPVHLPAGSKFTFDFRGRTIQIKILDKLWPISILDFNNEFIDTSLKKKQYDSIGKKIVKEDGVVIYGINDDEKNITEIFRTPYTRITIKFEGVKSDDMPQIAKDAFQHFYSWYKIISEDIFALNGDIVQILSRFNFHSFNLYTDQQLELDISERLNLEYEAEFSLGALTLSAYQIKKRYKPEFESVVENTLNLMGLSNIPSFVSETMTKANDQLNFYKNYKYALLE